MTSIEILGTGGPAVGNRLELEPAIRYASVTYSASSTAGVSLGERIDGKARAANMASRRAWMNTVVI